MNRIKIGKRERSTRSISMTLKIIPQESKKYKQNKCMGAHCEHNENERFQCHNFLHVT